MKARVTGIHPTHTTYYSLYYRLTRYDMRDGADHAVRVGFHPMGGTYTARVDSIGLVQTLQAAINEHKAAQECLL